MVMTTLVMVISLVMVLTVMVILVMVILIVTLVMTMLLQQRRWQRGGASSVAGQCGGVHTRRVSSAYTRAFCGALSSLMCSDPLLGVSCVGVPNEACKQASKQVGRQAGKQASRQASK